MSRCIREEELQGLAKKTPSKETEFINLEEETPEISPVNISSTHSPQNSPEQCFEGIPSTGSPGINPVQQQIYYYIESLEKKSASMDPESSANPELFVNPQEPLTNSLKQ